jgi:hypothetical protein
MAILTETIKNIADCPSPVTNVYAVIKLSNAPLGVRDAAGNLIGPTVHVTPLDSGDTWVSCDLEANGDLTPAGSFYEVWVYVNGGYTYLNKATGGQLVGHYTVQLAPAATGTINVSTLNPKPLPLIPTNPYAI